MHRNKKEDQGPRYNKFIPVKLQLTHVYTSSLLFIIEFFPTIGNVFLNVVRVHIASHLELIKFICVPRTRGGLGLSVREDTRQLSAVNAAAADAATASSTAHATAFNADVLSIIPHCLRGTDYEEESRLIKKKMYMWKREQAA